MAPATDAALPLPVDPTSPPPPTGAAGAADALPPPRPWYKYLFRSTFFFGGDEERAAARFSAVHRAVAALAASPAATRDDVRAFVAADGVYGPRLAADEAQAQARGLAGLLSGAAMASSVVRRGGAVFPTALVGAVLGGLTGNLFVDHIASWVLGTYKHDQMATRAALTAFVQQRQQQQPSKGGEGERGAPVAS